MDDKPVMLLLYVDDLFLVGNEKQISKCKKNLVAEFEMKCLGFMHYFLGLEIWRIPKGIFLNQGKYVVEILKMFDMLECKAIATPMDTHLKLMADGCDTIQTNHWFIDVSDEYPTRYMLCYEHFDSISY